MKVGMIVVNDGGEDIAYWDRALRLVQDVSCYGELNLVRDFSTFLGSRFSGSGSSNLTLS